MTSAPCSEETMMMKKSPTMDSIRFSTRRRRRERCGLVPRQPDLDEAPAGEGELDRVAADAAETVHDEVAAAPEERKFFFENIESLRRHTML